MTKHDIVKLIKPMHAEIVVTGSELLLGEIVDTNSTLMARMLRDIGLNLYYKTTVGDNRERMAAVLNLALDRSGVVLVSGGLGPTVDDVTRQAVADATDRPLVFDPELLEQIKARFERFGRRMTENNRRQAHVPTGAIVINNPVGTAPAFIVEDARGTIICLPGVPRELEYLMKRRVIPYLKKHVNGTAVIQAKILRTCAVGESQIDSLIGDLMTGTNPTIGLSAHSGQVDIRITAKAASQDEAEELITPLEAEVRTRLGSFIYGEGNEALEEVVARLLAERGMTLALADSVAGGEVADRLLDTSHQSVLLGGNPLPNLDVDDDPAIAAEQIARHVREERNADLGLAIWGTATKSKAQPVNKGWTGFLSLSDGARTITRPFTLPSGRVASERGYLRRWLSTTALDLIRRYLIDELGAGG
jgi:competence/damage-inducible protein CinA-like protein